MIDTQRTVLGVAASAAALAPMLAHIVLPPAAPAVGFASAVAALAIGWRFATLPAARPAAPEAPRTDWVALVRRLAILISARDQGVNGHVFNVEYYAVALAKHLQMSPQEQEAIALAAILHDIGKLGLPDRILLQDASLPSAEREVVKTHAAFGAAMVAGLPIPEAVSQIIRHHHENWDGSGYPDRLAGQHIPMAARIVSVADVYDALTSARAYRGAWTPQRALDHIRAQAGKQFDPFVVEALTAILSKAQTAEESGPAQRGQLSLPAATMASLHAVYAAGLESSLLFEMDRVFGSDAPTDEMLGRVAQSMQRCLSAPMCAIVTRDLESDILHPHWPAGSNGFPAWQRELVAVANRVIESRESWRGAWTTQGCAEGLVIPIERENDVLGALAVVRGIAGNQHLQLELTLQHVGARIAGAIDSSLLFDRARHHAFVDPMTGLYNIRYFKNYLDQICETARLAAAGWSAAQDAGTGHLPGRENGAGQPVVRDAGSPGVGDPAPAEPYDIIGGEPARNGDGRPDSGERPPSSRRLAEQPLTRRLVRREQTDSIPARVSGPRVVNGVQTGDVSRFTLLCLDLNNFKPVNDRFGHLEGDRVLRDIADRLRQTAPAGAVVARYGGDEFLIALPGYDAKDAAEAVSRIHAGVESYNCGLLDRNGMTLRISVSIGMSVFPADGLDSATLLSIADQRMFRMKTSRKASRGEPARA